MRVKAESEQGDEAVDAARRTVSRYKVRRHAYRPPQAHWMTRNWLTLYRDILQNVSKVMGIKQRYRTPPVNDTSPQEILLTYLGTASSAGAHSLLRRH